MSGKNNDAYEEARKLAEDALDAYAKGDPRQGDELVEQAKATNQQAVQEVAQELEEDKDSDHESFVAPDSGNPSGERDKD